MIEDSERMRRALRSARGETDPPIPPARRRPPGPTPEGVVIWGCQHLERGGGAVAPCRAREERRPHEVGPYHHGVPMRIVGYDWDREVE